MSKLELLLKRIQKPAESRHQPPPKTSSKLEMLIDRLNTREWLPQEEEALMLQIMGLRREVKWIEHLPGCRMCQLEVELDVERYLGKHIAWFVELESSEYWEKEDPTCPKEEDYKIDNYWWQVKRFRETGTTEWPESETVKFILDRAKWAYKIEGKEIHLARQKLKLVRNWDFSEKCQRRFERLQNASAPYFSSRGEKLTIEDKTPELLSMTDVMALDKEWGKHPITNRGQWQKKMFLNIEGAKLHVIIGVCGGLVQDTRVFTNEVLAAEYEKWLCTQYEIPYEKEAREKFYDENEVENEVYNYDVPINLALPLPPPVEAQK